VLIALHRLGVEPIAVDRDAIARAAAARVRLRPA